MIGPLLALGALVLLASKKRAPQAPPTTANVAREAERIVRESKEIIHGTRDSYSDPESPS